MAAPGDDGIAEPDTLTDEQWRERLTDDQFEVLRAKGTERPFTGVYWDHWDRGSYQCAGCGASVFDSATKFDGHCGWPSFNQAASEANVTHHDDASHGMHRVEVVCSHCGGHLGHLFDDAPDQPTGLRYCINSASLTFTPDDA